MIPDTNARNDDDRARGPSAWWGRGPLEASIRSTYVEKRLWRTARLKTKVVKVSCDGSRLRQPC